MSPQDCLRLNDFKAAGEEPSKGRAHPEWMPTRHESIKLYARFIIRLSVKSPGLIPFPHFVGAPTQPSVDDSWEEICGHKSNMLTESVRLSTRAPQGQLRSPYIIKDLSRFRMTLINCHAVLIRTENCVARFPEGTVTMNCTAIELKLQFTVCL